MRKVEIARGIASNSVSSVPAEGVSKAAFLAQVEREYPVQDGWEVVNSHFTGMQGNSIGLVFIMVQYKYVADD